MKMHSLVERFPAQLEEALVIGQNANLHPSLNPIHNIFVSGMGGSGIGANFAAEFVRNECSVPFIVSKGYDIPAFIGKNTLAIVSSYSGNTEETLTAFDLLLRTEAKIICVASGGKVITKAQELGLDYIQVPDNWPSPRACLGFSVVQQLFILHKMGLTSAQPIEEIKKSIGLLKKEEADIHIKAKNIAEMLNGKLPVIYGVDRMEPVLVRFRQQINENAKALCWHHVVPEMNHNELVGWTENHENIAVIYFRNSDDFNRNAYRIDINKDIIRQYASSVIEIFSKGNSLIERSMYFVYLGDWITCYLCDLRGKDSIEVNVIDFLKGELAKIA